MNLNLESTLIGFAFGVVTVPAAFWFLTNIEPLMDYAKKYPSNTAFLEYLGLMKRKD